MNRRKSIFMGCQVSEEQKDLEKSLSFEIDQNLRTLAIFHPFSSTAKSLFVQGAFMKPNVNAFQHVVHYLVMIYNQAEFRKKFRWPIVSKPDEADFRNAALVFFNECCTKFKWDFGPFKMQIILFPGGVDCMKIILEFSIVVMRLVVKRNGGMELHNQPHLTLRQAQLKLNAIETSFEAMQKIVSEIDINSRLIKKKTKEMREIIQRLIKNTSITATAISDGTLSSVWEFQQKNEIENEITSYWTKIEAFNSVCMAFDHKIDTICSPKKIEFNAEKLNRFSQSMKVLYPEMAHVFDGISIGYHEIDFEKLLQSFQLAIPYILRQLAQQRAPGLTQMKMELASLERLQQQINRLSVKMTAFDQFYDCTHIDTETKLNTPKQLSFSNFLKTMILQTPPISYVQDQKSQRINCNRLALLELPLVNDHLFIDGGGCLNLSNIREDGILPTPKKFCGLSKTNSNHRLDITTFRSHKLDPIAMLNNIQFSKSTSSKRDNRRRTLKWGLDNLTSNQCKQNKNKLLRRQTVARQPMFHIAGDMENSTIAEKKAEVE